MDKLQTDNACTGSQSFTHMNIEVVTVPKISYKTEGDKNVILK
jgi:hypothetical protein